MTTLKAAAQQYAEKIRQQESGELIVNFEELFDLLPNVSGISAETQQRRVQEDLETAGVQVEPVSGNWSQLDLDSRMRLQLIPDGTLPDDPFKPFAIVRTDGSPPDWKPWKHQEEAMAKLKAAWGELSRTASFCGMLVLPTGSGKTLTAVRWLYRDVLPEGYRVLWLAHRHSLLEQAASQFMRHATVLGHKAYHGDRLRIRTISGVHKSATTVGPDDDVILCSVMTLARHLDILDDMLKSRARPFITVVDEAHHAPAKSYQKILKPIKSKRKFALLGLTATPSRLVEGEQYLLSQLFCKKVFHSQGLAQLIDAGILARPVCTSVGTEFHEDELAPTKKDLAHFQRYRDLTPRLLNSLGQSVMRNKAIVEHWCRPPDYGKTLVFATDIAHCVTLSREFANCGIASGYVASQRDRNDGEGVTNATTLERFRRGEIQVLVNVEMLTEGVDVPDIQTVFFTRPTRSATLMMQMIGRGMRGPAAGGTKTVNLVSFVDTWRKFDGWLDPMALLEGTEERLPETDARGKTKPMATIPWDAIYAVADWVKERIQYRQGPLFQAVPHGWFRIEQPDALEVVESETPEAGREFEHVVVFAHQRGPYRLLARDLKQGKLSPGRLSPDRVRKDYFGDLHDPLPSARQLTIILESVKRTGAMPPYFGYKERDHIDPRTVAQEIVDKEMRPTDSLTAMKERYDEVARQIYPDFVTYAAEVDSWVTRILIGDGDAQRGDRPIVFVEEKSPLRPPPPRHSLPKLLLSAAHEYDPRLKIMPSIRWSDRVWKSFFACYRPSDDSIVVNRLLNSPDVSKRTLEFVVYHELLHRQTGIMGHDQVFRDAEKRFDGYIEANRELDTLEERFEWVDPQTGDGRAVM